MRGFLRTIDNINLAVGKFALCLLSAFWVLMVVGVIARYGFDAPLKWVPETTCFLFGASFMLAGAITLKYGEHVRVDILVRRLSPRTQTLLELVTSVALWLFGFMLLYWGGVGAFKSVGVLQTTGTFWDPPVWPVKLVIPLSAFLLLLQGVAKFIRDWHIARTGRGLEE